MKINLQSLTKLRNARVLVVGDLMIDRYWSGSTDRVSPEAPVPVVNIAEDELRAGGAANVALNAAALGAQVTLLGHTGDDVMAEQLSTIMDEQGVQTHFVRHAGKKTSTKIRVLSHDQQLLRLDFEQPLTAAEAAMLLPLLDEVLSACDVLVLSDYGKGTLLVAQQIITTAKALQKPVVVDPKQKDFSVYRGATVVTPNYKEFTDVVGHADGEEQIATKGMQLIVDNDIASLLVTRGKYGMMLLQQQEQAASYPTEAREVYDVTGAGDTVVATVAAAMAAGLELPVAAQLANSAAGIVVAKLGTATVTSSELAQLCAEELTQQRGVVDEEQSLHIREALASQGKRLVMTNGCFDLLHPGHLHYLQQAADLGDFLMIAVNSDRSVKALKGPTRPINPLADRMTMLAALECVDWVVAFDEDTPERLYTKLLPDVLVKGGDYKVEEVAGHKQVLANGGEVIMLDFVANYSSTSLIKKAQSAYKKRG